MASRIQGITIEIDGNTTGLQKALKGVDGSLKQTQSTLKDVDKLLKLDPKNTELLTQKQKALKDAIKLTGDRLEELKKAQSGVEEGSKEWDALQREIIATEQQLKSLQDQYKDFGSVTKQQIKAAGQAIMDYGDKVSEAGQKLAPLSGAATALLGGLVKIGYDAVKASDDLNTLSKQTGLTTAEIQKMQYAADLIDVSFSDIEGALKKLKPKLTESNETFQQLGISVTNADGSLRNTTDVFYDAIEALSQIENETERDQIAMELFGKGADALAGIIDDGGQALREYGEEAESLGLILSQDTLDALNETNDTIDKLKARITGSLGKAGATLARKFAPAVEKAAKFIEKLTDAIANLTPEQADLIVKIAGVVAAISPVLVVGGKLIKTDGLIVKAFNPVTLAIAAVVAAGILIYKNWDTIVATAEKLKKSITDTWNNIKTTVTNAATAVKTGVTNAWDSVKTATTNAWNTVKSTVQTAANNVKTSVTNTWNNIKTNTSTAWDGVKTVLTTKWNSIKTAYETHGGGLKGAASASVEAIKQTYSTGFDVLNTLLGGKLTGIKNAFTNAWNSVKTSTTTTWNSIKTSISDKITAAKNTVTSIVDKIKNAFKFSWSLPSIGTTLLDNLKKKVTDVVTNIKNAMKFNWNLPKLKLPHIKITYKAASGIVAKFLGISQIPQLSVDWYRKAYDNPVLFNSPTVLATPSGYKGFGDGHGAEIVMGLEKLRQLVGSSGDVVINVYASDGMDVNALADKIQDRFVAMRNQRRAAYA